MRILSLKYVFSNVYINNVIALIGINASGKTTILKVISFVISMLNNEPINRIDSRDILNGINDEDEVIKEKEEIILYNPMELNNYLSYGTIKGINVFVNAMVVFDNGGYLIVDELENHFNREIISTLIRFFMNGEVNYKGATIIFSTYYPELLDEFERNDNIYIVRNKNGINVENLSKILKRNDIKKVKHIKVVIYRELYQLMKHILILRMLLFLVG